MSVCQFLPWDSGFFGVRIARLEASRLTPAAVEEATEWCRAESIDCLYYLAPADERASLALRREFVLTDIRIRFELPLARGERPAAASVRPFRPGDLAALREIARVSHRDSRFYYDGRFDAARCDELYATWIERSAAGWANAVFVAEHGGAPAGYISCHISGTDGSIGLIAVGEQARGRGLGQALVQTALDYFGREGMQRALVVTQGRNTGSQRLYQRCGFVTESVNLWYHRWFEKLPSG